MNKTLSFAIVATALVALSLPAQALSIRGGGGGGGTPGGGDSDGGCTVMCDSGIVTVPDMAQETVPAGECGIKLGTLRRVTMNQIESVGGDDFVDIIRVCAAQELGAEQPNVAQLRSAIAENPVLDGELDQHGFHPNNVVGVTVTDGEAVLYVYL